MDSFSEPILPERPCVTVITRTPYTHSYWNLIKAHQHSADIPYLLLSAGFDKKHPRIPWFGNKKLNLLFG